MVLLKDPISGDYLIPKMPDTIDAGTLGGHPASDFLLKSEYTPADLSAYLKTVDADAKYAAITHNHDTVYALISHLHEMSQINGLETALAGKANSSHSHSASQITSGTLSTSRGGTGTTSLSSLANSLSPYLSSGGCQIAVANSTSITASFNIKCAIYSAYYGSTGNCGIYMATKSCTKDMGEGVGTLLRCEFTISGRRCTVDGPDTAPMLVVFG